MMVAGGLGIGSMVVGSTASAEQGEKKEQSQKVHGARRTFGPYICRVTFSNEFPAVSQYLVIGAIQ
jgi:hypothetical protein